MEPMRQLMRPMSDSKQVYKVILELLDQLALLAQKVTRVFLVFLDKMENLVVSASLDQKELAAFREKMDKMAKLVCRDELVDQARLESQVQ
jgi:hypothetical protein